MSKSVLIIDTPSSCKECIMVYTGYHSDFCFVTRNIPSDVGHYVSTNTKPNWCPLKPLPDKMEGYDSIKWQWGEYEDGWNHCILLVLFLCD